MLSAAITIALTIFSTLFKASGELAKAIPWTNPVVWCIITFIGGCATDRYYLPPRAQKVVSPVTVNDPKFPIIDKILHPFREEAPQVVGESSPLREAAPIGEGASQSPPVQFEKPDSKPEVVEAPAILPTVPSTPELPPKPSGPDPPPQVKAATPQENPDNWAYPTGSPTSVLDLPAKKPVQVIPPPQTVIPAAPVAPVATPARYEPVRVFRRRRW